MKNIIRSNVKVLIVEDEIIISTDVKKMLENRGYKVCCMCTSGEEAIALVAEHYPDIVVMDINLSGNMNGIEAANQIYKQFDIPVIYLTAHSDDITVNKAMMSDPFAYILKPVDDINLDVVLRLTVYKHKVFREVKKNEAMLRALSGQMDKIREHERKKISREIHDELGQYLTALKIDVFYLKKHLHEPELIDKKLDLMKDNISDSIKTVQRISRELRPDVLDNLPFGDAISFLINDFSSRFDVSVDLDVDTTLENLNSIAKTSIYRLVQEALTNGIRHSGAVNYFIKFEKNRSGYILEITDDGKGIDEAEIESIHSYGITGMRERVIGLGGLFSIKKVSEKGGTIVRAFIPDEGALSD